MEKPDSLSPQTLELAVTISPAASVNNLKCAIFNKFSIRPEHQSLSFCGLPLSPDTVPISKFSIIDGSILSLTLKDKPINVAIRMLYSCLAYMKTAIQRVKGILCAQQAIEIMGKRPDSDSFVLREFTAGKRLAVTLVLKLPTVSEDRKQIAAAHDIKLENETMSLLQALPESVHCTEVSLFDPKVVLAKISGKVAVAKGLAIKELARVAEEVEKVHIRAQNVRTATEKLLFSAESLFGAGDEVHLYAKKPEVVLRIERAIKDEMDKVSEWCATFETIMARMQGLISFSGSAIEKIRNAYDDQKYCNISAISVLNSGVAVLSSKLNLLPNVAKEYADRIADLHSILTKTFADFAESIDSLAKRMAKRVPVRRDIAIIEKKPKDCIVRIETAKLKIADETKLYDVVSIAKASSAPPETWLTKSEIALNASLNSVPVEEGSREFNLHLLKNAFEAVNKNIVFTESHASSTLNIHNVHLLSSTYAYGRKFNVTLDGAASNGMKIFEDKERMTEFVDVARRRIAEGLGVRTECVRILDVAPGSVKLSFLVEMDQSQRATAKTYVNGANDITKERVANVLKGIYGDILKDISTDDIFSTFVFDTQYLDPRYDIDYAQGSYPVADTRGVRRQPYYLPIGFRRLAINVLGIYEEDTWISSTETWAVAFHGVSGNPVADTETMIRQGTGTKQAFNMAVRCAYGPGVYCAPDYHIAEGYAASATMQVRGGSISYKCIFQCRVNVGNFEVLLYTNGGRMT